MGPIPPVSLGASAGASGLTRTVGAGATNGLNAANAPGRTAGASGSQRPSSELAQLTNLLQSLDGGKNSQLIQMLIGLMILLSILSQIDGGGSPTADRAGGGASTGGQQLFLQTTSTSISIEQQSTTIFYAPGQDAFDSGAAAAQQPMGEQLDLSA